MINLKDKRVLLTGPQSMIGRAVITSLKARGALIQPIFHEDMDLMNYEQTRDLIIDLKSEYVIHVAGFNGNIAFNSKYPADIFHRTSVMGQNILQACSEAKVKKVVSVLSSCGYKAGTEPLEEKDFLNGEPDPSTEAHAYGKRDILIFSKLLSRQKKLNSVCAIFNTAYGPYDNFDLDKTKVVGSLIKKFTEAVENKQDKVVCWGTGSPRRELIFSKDAGEALVQVLEKYDVCTIPLNIGFGEDYSIKEVSEKIANLTGFTGQIEWDVTKPDGQYRKLLNPSRMIDYDIVLKGGTSLEDGLKQTISWYKENKTKQELK